MTAVAAQFVSTTTWAHTRLRQWEAHVPRADTFALRQIVSSFHSFAQFHASEMPAASPAA